MIHVNKVDEKLEVILPDSLKAVKQSYYIYNR